jgi:hypothetical protein
MRWVEFFTRPNIRDSAPMLGPANSTQTYRFLA